MPYNDEQWLYFSDWHNYSKEKDIQYSEQEFDYFLNRLKNNQPFSLVRFGEGESRIVIREQKLDRPELTFDPTSENGQTYVMDLENAAKINHPNYFIGVQSYTYKPAEKNRPENEFIIQRNTVVNLGDKVSRDQYTCSRVFCNFYNRCMTDLMIELKKRPVYLVCSEDADPTRLGLNIKKVWKIPRRDAWKTSSYLYDEIQEHMSSIKDAVVLTCAGFFGNILISKLSSEVNFNINVGSVYDPILLGRTTRPYQRGRL